MNKFRKIKGPTCTHIMLLPKGHEPTLCRSCRAKTRNCARCNKPLPLAARVIGEDAYCFPCAQAISPPKECGLCGRLSCYLNTYPAHGVFVKACPKCRNDYAKKFLKTCVRCRKSRIPAGATADGHPLCAKCLPKYQAGIPLPPCTNCGKTGSKALKGGICQECYGRNTIRRSLQIHAGNLRQEWLQGVVLRFADSISRTCSYGTSIRLKKRLDFFSKLDENFASAEEITLPALYKLFGTGWERKYALMYSHLIRERLIAPAYDIEHDEVRNYDAQLRLLATEEGRWYHGLLTEFHKYMQYIIELRRSRGWKGQHIRYRQRTAKGFLKVAANFLASIDEDISSPSEIHQDMVDRFHAWNLWRRHYGRKDRHPNHLQFS